MGVDLWMPQFQVVKVVLKTDFNCDVWGDQPNYDRAEPVIQAYARSVKRLGEVGCGQLTKMVNQICVAGVVQSLAEAIHFAQRAGLDPLAVIEVISKGPPNHGKWKTDTRPWWLMNHEFGLPLIELVRILG